MSSIVNKIKDAVHSDKHSQPEGTHGPHGSRAPNAADPRIDSDRDHRADPASAPEGTYGHHSTRAGNAADPRVDSDGDRTNNYSYNPAATTTTTTTATAETAGMTGPKNSAPGAGTFYDSSGNRTTGYNDPEGTHGPHGSRVANAVDPRVDSDRDGSRNYGGTRGAYGENTHSQHGAPTYAKALGGSDVTFGGPENTGPAPRTAGPHKSDMMNKMDPRVDSNLDGSKTYGGEKTYAQSGEHSGSGTTTSTYDRDATASTYNRDPATSTYGRDPADAAQVPPSVMSKHIGEPAIHHDDHGHDRARRHSQATHQEQFRGI